MVIFTGLQFLPLLCSLLYYMSGLQFLPLLCSLFYYMSGQQFLPLLCSLFYYTHEHVACTCDMCMCMM